MQQQNSQATREEWMKLLSGIGGKAAGTAFGGG